MTNLSEYSSRELQRYVNAASGTGGLKIGAPVLVVGAIIIALSCGLCGGPTFKVAENITAADKARAQADEKAAQALVVEAENEKIIKEAEAKVLTDYSEVAKAAIAADRRRAHPEEIFSGLFAYAALCCLAMIAIPLVLLALWAVGNPAGFNHFLKTIKEGSQNAES
jgi:hypothetical protein